MANRKDSLRNSIIASESAPVLRSDDLGAMIRAKRRAEHLTLEQAAQASGVSAATLSRWERAKPGAAGLEIGSLPATPDTRTLAAITGWLGISLERMLHVSTPPPVEHIIHHEGETTPDIVEAHLRADPTLDTKTADALSRLFRAAYEQFKPFSAAATDEHPKVSATSTYQQDAAGQHPDTQGTHTDEDTIGR